MPNCQHRKELHHKRGVPGIHATRVNKPSIYVRNHLSEAVPLDYKTLRHLTAGCDHAISSCRHLQPRNLVPGQHCPRAGGLDLGAAGRCPGPSAVYLLSSRIASVRSLLSLRSSRKRADPLLWRMHQRRRALPLACPDRQSRDRVCFRLAR